MRKRLMSNGTLRPERPGKFDRIFAAIQFAMNIVELNNAARKLVERKERVVGIIRGDLIKGESVISRMDALKYLRFNQSENAELNKYDLIYSKSD